MKNTNCGFCQYLVFIVAVALIACSNSGTDNADTHAKATNERITLRWVDYSWSVFHGIPARAKLTLPKDLESDVVRLKLQEIFKRVDRCFNAFDPTSEVGLLNRLGKKKDVEMSRELSESLHVAHEVYSASEGAFDPTVWPLKQLWSKAKKRQSIPSEQEYRAALKNVGLENVVLSGRSLRLKKPGTMFDLGGLAKGYAVDWMTWTLKSLGVQNAMLQIGGEIRTWGRNESGNTWQIGIQHPFDMEAIYGSLGVDSEVAYSTSGNYRQPIQIGETTYYHIFDPRTGRPLPSDILGVTVVMSGSKWANARADAWATALTVLGVEKGLEMARRHDFDVLYLVQPSKKSNDMQAEIRAIMTPGLRGILRAKGE